MLRERILIVDDDPDILDVLKLTLGQEDYEVIEAMDGASAINLIKTKSPSLVILDYKMPGLSGLEVCKIVKDDILLQYLPIIMLTGKGEVSDKVKGINAGVDDYIVKPFEPQELIARVKMILRRTERDLDANPLTHLPGNVTILNELQRWVDAALKDKTTFAVGYLDIDKFKSYNDKYGFEHGDEVIKETARIIIHNIRTFGNADDFIGHIGVDDFVFITTPDKIDQVCSKIIGEFDSGVGKFYNQEDRQRGYIFAKDRQRKEQKVPLLSISIGVVTNETREIAHVAQIGEIGAELKGFAKQLTGSNFVKDKRK